MQQTYTEDLAQFGYRERELLIELLQAWNEQGLPADFSDENVRPAFNMSSGYVFLTNEDYQVAMIRNGSLEVWHSLPYSGQEGFIFDLMEDLKADELNSEDVEYIQQYNPAFGNVEA